MLDTVIMDYENNTATMVFESGRVFTLSSDKSTCISRFYEWFISKEFYPLLDDETWQRTMEDTQPIISLKEVA
jgi:hypothetical protein